MLLQILDGTLTYMGVTWFSLDAEGNPLIKYIMETLGIICGLVVVKLGAIGIIYYLKNICTKPVLVSLMLLSVVYSNVVALWVYVLIIS